MTAPSLAPLALVLLAISQPGDADLPCDVCFVRELHLIPEVDTWTYCDPVAYPEQTKRIAAVWPKIATKLQPLVTPALVRRLSQYSQSQMASYNKIPSLAGVKLTPQTQHRDGALLVFAGRIDTLPSHSPLVKRWLEAYVLYNAATGAAERVTIAVRGQVEE
jgi:hypothetical protein